MAPVIMVPGSSASQNRFDSLITELGKETPKKHSVLKLTVQTDGTIKYSGSIAANDNEPFIVIGFANNRDGKANIDKQAVWLNTAFKALVKTYHFNHFYALGHSNGGLIWTLLLFRCCRSGPFPACLHSFNLIWVTSTHDPVPTVSRVASRFWMVER